MKLEASPVRENAVRMNQIQTQLENLTLQLQDIKKGKENMGIFGALDAMQMDIPSILSHIFKTTCC